MCTEGEHPQALLPQSNLTGSAKQGGGEAGTKTEGDAAFPSVLLSYFAKGKKIFSVGFLGTDEGNQAPPDVKCFPGFLVTYENLTSIMYLNLRLR